MTRRIYKPTTGQRLRTPDGERAVCYGDRQRQGRYEIYIEWTDEGGGEYLTLDTETGEWVNSDGERWEFVRAGGRVISPNRLYAQEDSSP